METMTLQNLSLSIVLLSIAAGCTVETQAEPAAAEPMQASAGGSVVVEGPESASVGQPISCGANDDVNLTNVTLNAGQGSAIVADGNCTLTIDGCNLSGGNVVRVSDNATVNLTGCSISGMVAIDASGQADVNLTGGSISGTQAAVVATDNAGVSLSGTAESGAMQAGENADISRE